MENSEKGNTSNKRVAVFVDGFNVYHFLDKTPGLKKYKWLNYRRLAEHFCLVDSIIDSVYYFTALVKFDSEKNKRHNVFIRALKTQDIVTVKGKFKPVKRKFVLEDRAAHKNLRLATAGSRVELKPVIHSKRKKLMLILRFIY